MGAGVGGSMTELMVWQHVAEVPHVVVDRKQGIRLRQSLGLSCS